MEVPGFHHVMSLFSRTGFLFFHSIYGYFKNIYCEGGGNKAQKRVLFLGAEERLSDSLSRSKFGLIKRE